MRYSLRSLLIVTTWLGMCLGIYASMIEGGWHHELVRFHVWLTWLFVAFALVFSALPQRREAVGLAMLAGSVLLILLCVWPRFRSFCPEAWRPHILLHSAKLATGLFWAGMLTFLWSRLPKIRDHRLGKHWSGRRRSRGWPYISQAKVTSRRSLRGKLRRRRRSEDCLPALTTCNRPEHRRPSGLLRQDALSTNDNDGRP